MTQLRMIAIWALVVLAPRPIFAYMDLHSHLFMSHGMGAFFKGDFNKPLKATHWKNLLKSKINHRSLNESGVRIMVASLYAHPVLVTNTKKFWHQAVRESVKRQVAQAREFVKNNPNWILATDPKEALKAYSFGKKILILSLEGAHSVFKNDDDIDFFIDQLGISIVTPLHLINTQYGGAAFMKGFRKTIFTTKHFSNIKREGVKINPKKLTDKGEWLIKKLIEKKVWIDLTHAGDFAQEQIIKLTSQYHLPLLYTHTSPRFYHRAERGLADWAIDEIKKYDGFVGLVPSEEMIGDTEVNQKFCPVGCQRCRGGTFALATQYDYLAKKIGAENISLGIDFNGGIKHLAPSTCELGNSLDDKNGLFRATQIRDIWDGLKKLKVEVPRSLKIPELRFLQLWLRVRN